MVFSKTEIPFIWYLVKLKSSEFKNALYRLESKPICVSFQEDYRLNFQEKRSLRKGELT